MGPVKDWCIQYKNSGDKFTGRSVTDISCLMKEFAILSPHWDFTDWTEEGKEEKVDQLLRGILVRENDVSGSTFIVFRFLYAFICYHYEHLDRTIHKKKGWGGLQFSLLHCKQENFENTQSYHSHGWRLPLHPFSRVSHPMLWWWQKLKCWRRLLQIKHALKLMVWRLNCISATSLVMHIRIQWYLKRWKERMRWCTPNSAVLLATLMAELCTIILNLMVFSYRRCRSFKEIE